MKKLIQELNNLKVNECIKYDLNKISTIPAEIEISDLILEKRKRWIGFCLPNSNLPFEIQHTLQAVDWYGYKETYAVIGLSIISLLFKKTDYIKLKVTHPISEIPTIYIYFDKGSSKKASLVEEGNSINKSYEYFRFEVEKFPFSGVSSSKRNVFEADLPSFTYGWENGNFNSSTSDAIKNANQVIISLTAKGVRELGALFLDMSARKNEQTEVCLENPSLGFGGVCEHSLEARFWLPNSFGFHSENINDLILTQNHPDQKKVY